MLSMCVYSDSTRALTFESVCESRSVSYDAEAVKLYSEAIARGADDRRL